MLESHSWLSKLPTKALSNWGGGTGGGVEQRGGIRHCLQPDCVCLSRKQTVKLSNL